MNRLVLLLLTLLTAGCGPDAQGLFWSDKKKGDGSITPEKGPSLPLNQGLPLDPLKNHVEDPELGQFALDQFCGSVVQQGANGLFKPMGITIVRPTLSVPTQTSIGYHSLIDQGGAASVNAAWGVAGANFAVSGQDRLEVTVKTQSFCKADFVTTSALGELRSRLLDIGVDESRVFFVVTASLSEMAVDTLMAISAEGGVAATPIFNFNGSNYSKRSDTKVRHFIALYTVPVFAMAGKTAGQSVAASSPPSGPPIQVPIGTPPPAAQPVAAPSMQLLSPQGFAAALKAATTGVTVKIR